MSGRRALSHRLRASPRTRLHRPQVGRGDRAAAGRIHPHPLQVSALRSALAGQRAPRRCGRAWRRHGAARSRLPGMQLEVVRLPGRTPVLCFEVPGTGSASATGTVLMYGHLDKQPEMTGWREGSRPVDAGDRARQAVRPRRRRRRLCGVRLPRRAPGAARAGRGRTRAVVGLIECCEESGSYDLPAYLEALAPAPGRGGRW